MNTAFWIWLYLAIEDLTTVACFAVTTVYLIWLIAVAISLDTYDKEEKATRMLYFKSVLKRMWIPAVFIVLVTLVPTRDDLKYIIGGAVVVGAASAASDIKGMQELPENLVNAANAFLSGVAEEGTVP